MKVILLAMATLLHPDVHAPWQQWSGEATLHVAAAYSNPFRFATRRILANRFRQHMLGMPNVHLVMAELAYGERPFEIDSEIQLRTSHELWHKENLINVAVSRFQADWKYGAYVDADFHMS